MKNHKYCFLVLLIFIMSRYTVVSAQQDLAQQAHLIFEQNCLGCHGPHGAFTEDLIIESASGLINTGAVVPGKPAIESELYKRLWEADDAKRMPLGGQLSPQAILTIGNWIQAGAPSWDVQHDVNFITTDAMLTAIENHLNALDPFDRPFVRYFTTTHLYNAGESPEALGAYHVALSKLVNSLSWGSDIINPHPIDAAETIFYIDLRNYEWDIRDAWTQIEEIYPYTIEFNVATHVGLHEKLTNLRQEMACEVPFVHADWFLATASLPPLYHDILALPATERELERELGIDVERNLRTAPGNRVWRAGTNNSGVSTNNRVVERHRSPHGAYWKSHDFASSVDEKNIFTHPLFFERDGGEVIFNLPNGLQAYYISDALGNRIDVAPTEIVSNPAASDPAVRNGISCIGCHTEGMKTFEDEVRSVIQQTVNPSYDKAQALRLYAEKTEIDRLVREDTQRYRDALEETGGVFGGIEPVHRFYEAFQDALDAAHAAAAIGLETEAFRQRISQESSLQNLGLTGLLSGGNVKRDVWTSNFEAVVSCLYGDECLTHEEDDEDDPDPRLIPDPNLRAAIAERLGKAPTDSITDTDLARLTELVADERGIRDLRGLEHAVRLERIELRRNSISNLSPLAGLVRLNNIKLRGNKITDVSPLGNLINVDWLGLEENAITDVSPLAGLVKLNGIGLEGNPISDVSPLAGCISLEGINARRTAISDFSSLAKLARFRWLEMDRSNISNLSGLAELTQLTRLQLNDNSIKDITPLAKLTRLESLELVNNTILDVSPLAGLTNLEHLHLRNNIISDVSPLAGLTNLKQLSLNNNAIADFSPLKGLAEKIYIHASNNPGTLQQGGPKITGPWLWVQFPGLEANDFKKDVLAGASGREVTELQIATNGATEGQSVGDSVWTSGKIQSEGWNNIGQMLGARGDASKTFYGSITLDSPREQETKMFAGSADWHKVWLNGELVNEKLHWNSSHDYQEFFPVTLKQGKNVLLIAVWKWDGWVSGYFGFAPDAEYTVLNPGTRFSLSTSATRIRKGDIFTLRLNTADITDLAGWQTDIAFDPALLKVNGASGINEGNFLKQGNGRTFFQKGTIKNKQGSVTGIKSARISRGGATGEGRLLSIRFTALANGQGRVVFRNFRAGNSAGQTIPSTLPEIIIAVGNTPAAPVLLPDETALLVNYPNPFNPETWIPYQLAVSAEVAMRIYAANGALVRTLDLGHQSAGIYAYRSRAAYWDGKNEVGEPVASGIYFYTLTAGDFTATRKMLIKK